MSGSILEYITQTIYFDKDKYSKKEIDEASLSFLEQWNGN